MTIKLLECCNNLNDHKSLRIMGIFRCAWFDKIIQSNQQHCYRIENMKNQQSYQKQPTTLHIQQINKKESLI